MNDPADVHPDRPSRAGRLTSALGPVGVLGGMAGVGALTFALVTVEAGEQHSAAFVASVDYVLWRLLMVLLVLTSLVAAFIVRPRLMELRHRYPGATWRWRIHSQR